MSERQSRPKTVAVERRTQCEGAQEFLDNSPLIYPPRGRLQDLLFATSTMADTHYPDAGHSEPPPEYNSDSIELTSLEDLAITPDLRHNKHDSFHHHDSDSEEDSGDEDEGDRALLAPGDRSPSGEEDGFPPEAASVWVQARGIVVEVFLPIVVSLNCSFNCRHARLDPHYC